MKSVKIVVIGRVQGVAFRYYTRHKAGKLGIRGTVQNLPDGTVKIYAIGTSEAIDNIINWCYKGSPASKVESVAVSDWTGDQSIIGFRIVR